MKQWSWRHSFPASQDFLFDEISASVFQGLTCKIFTVANLSFLLGFYCWRFWCWWQFMFIWNLRDSNKKKTRQSEKTQKRENSKFSFSTKNKLHSFISACWIVAALYAIAKPLSRRKCWENLREKLSKKYMYIDWSWGFTGVPTIGFKNLILHSWAAICIRFMKSKKSAHKKSTAKHLTRRSARNEWFFSVFSAPFLSRSNLFFSCFIFLADASCQRRDQPIFVWRHNCDINSDAMLP